MELLWNSTVTFVFKLNEIDKDKLAESLGLANSPQIDFGE